MEDALRIFISSPLLNMSKNKDRKQKKRSRISISQAVGTDSKLSFDWFKFDFGLCVYYLDHLFYSALNSNAMGSQNQRQFKAFT